MLQIIIVIKQKPEKPTVIQYIPTESIASRGVLSVKNIRLHIINHTSQFSYSISKKELNVSWGEHMTTHLCETTNSKWPLKKTSDYMNNNKSVNMNS